MNRYFISKFEFSIALSFLLLFSFLSFNRNAIWFDDVSLWKDGSKKSPFEARPSTNLGVAYVSLKRFDEAIVSLLRAVEADPRYIEPHYHLAFSYIRKGLFDKAASELNKTLKIIGVLKRGHFGESAAPAIEFKANVDMANILSMRGDFTGALPHYRRAIEISPRAVVAHFNLAIAYKKLGMLAEAKGEFEEVLKINPEDEGAAWNLNALALEN